jgi:hypothetical protein
VSDLAGCRAKLDWAEKNLDSLNAELKTFFEDDAQTFVTKFDEADQAHVITFKEANKIPIEWGIALGNIVHDVRSALDHLVYQLVLLAGATYHRRHQFPILDHPNDWIGKVNEPPKKGKEGLLDFIDLQHVAVIESVQPYQPVTGLPRLKTLRRFSNTDKHRLIHAARASITGTPQITVFVTIPSVISDLRAPKPGTTVEDGTEVARFRSYTKLDLPKSVSGGYGMPLNAEMNVDAKFPTTVVFGEPGSEDTRAKEFRLLIEDAREIVERLAPSFS